MNNWKETTLGEVAEFCYGKMPEKDRVTLSGNYPVFSGYRVVGYYDEYNSDEDLIVVARGVGGTGDVKISPPKSYVTNLSIIVKLKEDKVSKQYLAYKCLNNNLRYLDSGSAQSQITISDLQKIEFILPSLPEQKAIAAILSSFDEKIELLRRQNKTLERIAQAIFKEWFVKFEVKGEKLKINSKTSLPEGWRMGKYGDLADVKTGKGLKKEFIKEKGSYLVLGANGEIGRTDSYLFDEDLVLTGRVGTLGAVYISRGKVWISDNVLISKPLCAEYFYFVYL